MLTTYSLFERDELQYRLDRQFLCRWRWGHMICDEAHALKNANSTRSKKLRKVRRCVAGLAGARG
jgi:SWI/SNF-related matrix-associated actin-dependent regulator 1 of chromatin subfamily A